MRTITLLVFLCFVTKAQAAIYYISSSSGNDSRTFTEAQNPASPWQSLSKLNSVFSSLKKGDQILLKRGDTFFGTINVSINGDASNPIVIGAYGSGNKPVITGYIPINNWRAVGGGKFETTVSWFAGNVKPMYQKIDKMLNLVSLNGKAQAIGRYPKANLGNNSYFTIASHSSFKTLSSNNIAGIPNFVGGELVQRSMQWIIDRSIVKGQYGNTIDMEPLVSPDHPANTYSSVDGNGFYFQNHINTLTNLGEWCFNVQNSTLTMHFGSSNPNAYLVEIPVVNNLINISDKSFITVQDIALNGANENLVHLDDTKNCRFLNIDFTNAGVNGLDVDRIYFFRTANNEVSNCTFKNINNNAINLVESPNWTVSNNTITDIGTVSGMGKSGDGQYIAIFKPGSNSIVEYNTIDNIGYTGIWFAGSNTIVQYNEVGNFCLVKSDGGGIYSYDYTGTNRLVYRNIVHDGIGNRFGILQNSAPNPYSGWVHGIYADSRSSNITISENTVFNNAHSGLFLGSANNLNIKDNLFYNNKTTQIKGVDNEASFGNINFQNNVVFAKEKGSIGASLNLNSYSLSEINANNNYYCRPLWEPDEVENAPGYSIIPFNWDTYHDGGMFESNSRYYSVEKWKKFANKDWQSKKAPKTVASINEIFFDYNASKQKKTIALDGTYMDVKGKTYTSYTLDPYTSVVLLKTQAANKINQTINFASINAKVFGDAPFALSASASSGLPVTLKVLSGPATISGSTITITGVGAVSIEASQGGDVNYHAATSITNTFNVAAPIAAVTCSATGSILREEWSGVAGIRVADIPFSANPTATNQIAQLETENTGANMGSRIRGYLCPPFTGNYTFSIAGDDHAEVWVSTDNLPENKRLLASITGWSGLREYNKYSSQKSSPVSLVAGQRYYIEVLHKNGAGGDNVSVKWDMPNGVTEAPIPGSRLSPFAAATPVTKLNQSISFGSIPNQTLGALPFNISASSTSNLPVTLKVISGPAVLVNGLVTLTGVGTVTIEATQPGNINYNVAPPVSRSFTVIPALVQVPTQPSTQQPATNGCTATGSILREEWKNVKGISVADIPLSKSPNDSEQLYSLQTRNTGSNLGSRISGYICPPITGNYTFHIAGDDGVELWLSSDRNPSNKVKIASVVGWTDFQDWNTFASQKSARIVLQSGQSYYIEVLHKNGAGGDHMSVKWELPNGVTEAPIPGSRLSPFVGAPASNTNAGSSNIITKLNQYIIFNALPTKTFGDAPFTLGAEASSQQNVLYRVVSGPASVNGDKVTMTGVGTVLIEASQPGDNFYNPAIPVQQSFTVIAKAASICTATGSILREEWTNVKGTQIANIPTQKAPNNTSELSALETQNTGSEMGARIRGYICPPTTGGYTFYISGDDAVELWLSTSERPEEKVKIAGFTGWTDFRDFNKLAGQKSAVISLEKGQSYYIEVLHKNGAGGDHVSVMWELPNGKPESPIPGSRLSPYKAPAYKHAFRGEMSAQPVTTNPENIKPAQGRPATVASKAPLGNAVNEKTLLSVYPNPFQTMATLKMVPAETGEAVVEMFDVQGRPVKAIYRGSVEAGVVRTFALNSSGLASGVYIVRMVTKNGVVSQKVTLNK